MNKIKKRKTIKLISRPLLIWSESTVLFEIKQRLVLLEERLIVLKQKLIEEKTMNSKIKYN